MSPQFHILACSAVRPAVDATWADRVPAANKRRDPRIWQMACVAVADALKQSPRPPVSVLSATALGALDETQAYLDGVFKTNFGSPRNFIASVHNSMAGKLAIDFKILGPNFTLCDGPNSLASALAAASLLGPDDFPALVVAVDEKTALLRTLAPHFAAECTPVRSPEWEEGAVAFVIDLQGSGPTVSARGPVPVMSDSPETVFRRLAAAMRSDGATLVLPGAASDSFVKPALLLFDAVHNRVPGRTVIGAHSPSSTSVSAIDLCP
jgi:hypothetical protein